MTVDGERFLRRKTHDVFACSTIAAYRASKAGRKRARARRALNTITQSASPPLSRDRLSRESAQRLTLSNALAVSPYLDLAE